MNNRLVVNVPPDYKCPITLEIMRDPVILLGDGHSYERKAIEGYLEQSRNPVSPLTGEPLAFKIIVSNLALKKIIDDFIQNNPLLDPSLNSSGFKNIGVNVDAAIAAKLEREQDEIDQAKLHRKSPLISYQKNLKAYLEQRHLLKQHTGDNNYDVFISYAWEDKYNKLSHEKLQLFLIRLHGDLQEIGLKVFLDIHDMRRDMRELMITSIEQSGIVLSICKPFLKEAIEKAPNGNIALEMNCLLERVRHDQQVFLPLLCEGEEISALPTPVQQQLSSDVIQSLLHDIRALFSEFNPAEQFSPAYMQWFTDRLVPRILANLGINPEEDILLETLTQLFQNQVKQQQLPNLHQMLPRQQFQHNQPDVTEEKYTEQRLQAFEFFLRRLQELGSYRKKVAMIQSVLLVYQREPDRDSLACQALDAWIQQFAQHLTLAGIHVTLWSEGHLIKPLPVAVVMVCTPHLKQTMDHGLQQAGSVWQQLQHHLAQRQVVCCPIVYQGTYGNAVPTWSLQYPQWAKSLLVRNTKGRSLKITDDEYHNFIVKSEQSKGLLLDLLNYEDDDPCYLWLLQNLQHMLFGWGTRELLTLEQNILKRKQSAFTPVADEKQDSPRFSQQLPAPKFFQNEDTPLLKAASTGKLDILQWLLQNGSSLLEKDKDGNGALHRASLNGHLEIVKWLLTEGGANLSDKNQNDDTVFEVAKTDKIRHFLKEFSSALQRLNLQPMSPSPKRRGSLFEPKEEKHAPNLDQIEVEKFIKLVTDGRQDEAEALLKAEPLLALTYGKTTDNIGRPIQRITAFQYAVYVLDAHMWEMMLPYFTSEHCQLAYEQFRELETHGIEYGKEQNWKKLIDEMKKYSYNYGCWSSEERLQQLKVIGEEQDKLAQHVISEYCRPDRPFYPVPNFEDGVKLPRGQGRERKWKERTGNEWIWSRGEENELRMRVERGRAGHLVKSARLWLSAFVAVASYDYIDLMPNNAEWPGQEWWIISSDAAALLVLGRIRSQQKDKLSQRLKQKSLPQLWRKP